VDRGRRREAGLEEVRARRRGGPWRSAGPLQRGDPTHSVTWATDQARPTLLPTQPIGDVEPFGAAATTYGTHALGRAARAPRFTRSGAGPHRGAPAGAGG
jgi:hypothetical protein